MPSLAALTVCILAAGKAERIGGHSKAALLIEGKTALEHLIEKFAPHAAEIIIGLRPEELARTTAKLAGLASLIPIKYVEGGSSRFDTIERLVACAASEWILVHDVARPYLSEALIGRLFAEEPTSALCCGVAIPCRDALGIVENNKLIAGLDRRKVYQLQTPVIAPKSWIADAICYAKANHVKDDGLANLLLSQNRKVVVVEGEETNKKITYIEDLSGARPPLI